MLSVHVWHDWFVLWQSMDYLEIVMHKFIVCTVHTFKQLLNLSQLHAVIVLASPHAEFFSHVEKGDRVQRVPIQGSAQCVADGVTFLVRSRAGWLLPYTGGAAVHGEVV